MKLTIGKDQMLNGLQAVQNIVGSRTTLPVLSNVLLRAEGERLELTATDLDVTISCAVEAKVQCAGRTTLPVKRLTSIVRELGVLELELEVDDRHCCTIQAGGSFFRVHGLAAEEFPPLPGLGECPPLVLPQEKVRTMLRRTEFAMSADETRYVLNGLFLSLRDHKVAMVATDGRRMALADEEVELPPEVQADLIVPSKAVIELSRLIHEKGELDLFHSENQVGFRLRDERGGMTMLISKLVDGTYPNYRQVIPAQSKERIMLPREEFAAALRRAEIMTSDKSNSVKLSFSQHTLAITANMPEVGEARETMAVNYNGEPLAVAFNPVFLLDALKALDTDEVAFELTNELSPGVLKINGPFLYVIMPMRMT